MSNNLLYVVCITGAPCDQSRLNKFLECANEKDCFKDQSVAYDKAFFMCIKARCITEMSEIFKEDNSACLNCIASSTYNINE